MEPLVFRTIIFISVLVVSFVAICRIGTPKTKGDYAAAICISACAALIAIPVAGFVAWIIEGGVWYRMSRILALSAGGGGAYSMRNHGGR